MTDGDGTSAFEADWQAREGARRHRVTLYMMSGNHITFVSDDPGDLADFALAIYNAFRRTNAGGVMTINNTLPGGTSSIIRYSAICSVSIQELSDGTSSAAGESTQ